MPNIVIRNSIGNIVFVGTDHGAKVLREILCGLFGLTTNSLID